MAEFLVQFDHNGNTDFYVDNKKSMMYRVGEVDLPHVLAKVVKHQPALYKYINLDEDPNLAPFLIKKYAKVTEDRLGFEHRTFFLPVAFDQFEWDYLTLGKK